jgi:excisionase family DNA binding protein
MFTHRSCHPRRNAPPYPAPRPLSATLTTGEVGSVRAMRARLQDLDLSPCGGTPDRRTAPDALISAADQLLTVADVAGRISAHEQTVRGWIKTGELKAARFGTRIGYRIKRSDYEDFLHRRTLTGAITAHLLKAASTAPDA